MLFHGQLFIFFLLKNIHYTPLIFLSTHCLSFLSQSLFKSTLGFFRYLFFRIFWFCWTLISIFYSPSSSTSSPSPPLSFYSPIPPVPFYSPTPSCPFYASAPPVPFSLPLPCRCAPALGADITTASAYSEYDGGVY